HAYLTRLARRNTLTPTLCGAVAWLCGPPLYQILFQPPLDSPFHIIAWIVAAVHWIAFAVAVLGWLRRRLRPQPTPVLPSSSSPPSPASPSSSPLPSDSAATSPSLSLPHVRPPSASHLPSLLPSPLSASDSLVDHRDPTPGAALLPPSPRPAHSAFHPAYQSAA